MSTPRVLGFGTAVPGQRYEQVSLFEKQLKPYFQSTRHAEAIFRNTGVGYRYLAVPLDFYLEERTTQMRNELYMQIARPLGEMAIRRCLDDAGLTAEAVDDFIVVSCTGIDTPGLDLILAGSLGMRSDLRRSSILGMGCYAALPGLSRARESVLARPFRRTLTVAPEIYSLHF
jgi:predicted naringenin-chalcone synthase